MSNIILNPNTDDEIKIEYNVTLPNQKLLYGEIAELKDVNINEINSEIKESYFEKGMSEFDKTNYLIAATSGLFSGLLNVLWSKDFKLEDAQSWGKDKVENLVFKIGKMQGCKKNDLQGIIKELEEKYKIPADKLTSEFGGGKQHHLRDFSHHPSIIGLVSSILNQFGIGIGTNTNGNFVKFDISENDCTGKTFAEKIYNAFVIWSMHLISDMAGSSSNPGAGTGIPGPILSFFKEVSTLPIIKDIKTQYKDDDISFSVFISKLFNGTYFKDENGNPIRVDLRTEIGVLANQSKSVLINECIVRAIYTLRNLYLQVKNNNIKTIKELSKLNIKEILPFKSRSLTRMLTISTRCFCFG